MCVSIQCLDHAILQVLPDIIPALPNEFHRYDKSQNLRL